MISLPGRGDHIDLDSDCCGECSEQSAQLARLARGNLAVLLSAYHAWRYAAWRQSYYAMLRHSELRRTAGDPASC